MGFLCHEDFFSFVGEDIYKKLGIDGSMKKIENF
jgi:hypothetical protein